MIYRIAEQADWVRAQREGAFASADLAEEGFIHCSEQHQVARTAKKYYAGKTALVLLEIDDGVLGTALVREDLTGSGLFPHSYAPIPLVAIVRHFDFAVAMDGSFALPAGLEWSSNNND
ncbi:MAG: DUF952 domain-containing protein [Burkholderiales bacterium]|nr:DUF952 domain-containing protein [Burkholderiales bacterium]